MKAAWNLIYVVGYLLLVTVNFVSPVPGVLGTIVQVFLYGVLAFTLISLGYAVANRNEKATE